MTDTSHWLDCIRAFLHDPPDKAFDIKGHEQRTCEALAAALNIPDAEARGLSQKQADWLASACERLPLPKGTLWGADNKPLPDDQQRFNRIPAEKLERTDPISGGKLSVNITVAKSQAPRQIEVIRNIAQANADMRQRALALWRLLPEELGSELQKLPGDTRLTDHSIIDHADAAMAACAALRPERGLQSAGDERNEVRAPGASLLVFSLGPVQSFIVQGRSLRDLWTGSYLLSWLTAAAMRPILEHLGPWAITSPGLRGNPLTDWWLEQQKIHKADGTPVKANRKDLRWAGLPNTFTALVPTAQADSLAAAATEACRDEWNRISEQVHIVLRNAWGNTDGWDRNWQTQCDQVWDVRTVMLPFMTVTDSGSIVTQTAELRAFAQRLLGELPKPVQDASDIAEALVKAKLAPGYVTREGQGLWMLANDLAQRLMAADKTARQVPPPADPADTREKCVLFPGFAVMGPNGDTAANKRWWSERRAPPLPGQIKVSEQLSAPGLVKRYAFGAYFQELLGRDAFPDTRAAAFGHWLAEFKRRVPDGTLHWENWRKVVTAINRRSGDEFKDEWTAHELLDPGQMTAIAWVHSQADEADKATVREKLRHAHSKRQELLISRAKAVHLPEPKPYYAVLVADGDHMGQYLRGERGPSFEKAYHPWMAEKLRSLDLDLSKVRPQGMASQLAFSGALSGFTREAGRTIAGHHGTCVYAGGDDVLAVLPVATALLAAHELSKNFSTWVPGATLSAGLAIVHCQEDLRVAIVEARKAETLAKSIRNALGCRIVRRSGEISEALAPWEVVQDWHQTSKILAGQSDRWVHHLLEEQDALEGLISLDPVWARLRHHLLHGEEGRRRRAGNLDGLLTRLTETWGDATTGMRSRLKDLAPEDRPKDEHLWLVHHFLTWCHHAAWLAKFHPTTPVTASTEATP